MMGSYRYAPGPRGAPAGAMVATFPRDEQRLKSCLRQGTFSRGGGSAGSTRSSGSSPSLSPSQGTLRLHYQRQQRREEQQNLRNMYQAREDESSTARSALSAPTPRSSAASGYSSGHPSLAASSCSASTAQSAASAPTATRSNRRYNSESATYGNEPQHDRRRGREDAGAGDSEREFMRMSKLLVTQHMAAGSNHPALARRLLHEHLPDFEQRRAYHQSLRRNAAYLPMFPEPNEHPSLAMTRYIDKMFGSLLAQDVKQGGGEADRDLHLLPPAGYGAQRYPPQQYAHQGNVEARTATHRGSEPRQTYNQTVASSLLDRPMFPPPTTENAAHRTSPDAASRRDPIPTPAPIPIQPQVPAHAATLRTDIYSSQPIYPNSHAPTGIISAQVSAQATDATNLSSGDRDEMAPAREKMTSPVAHVTFSPSTGHSTSFSSVAEAEPLYPAHEKLAGKHSSRHDLLGRGSTYHGSNHSTEQSTSSGRSLIGNSTESSLDEDGRSEGASDSLDSSGRIGTDENGKTTKWRGRQRYQTFSTKDMLPPLTPRENILYFPQPNGSLCGNSSPCCNRGEHRDENGVQMMKRPPDYLQLYVKCERSEPYFNENLDIVTWYRDRANRVTADRTLVVKNTASAFELIRGIVESFGLTSIPKDGSAAGGRDGSNGLGCYKEICFVSDIKTATCPETAKTNLTPLPIPGLQPLPSNEKDVGEGLRNRLALVFCAPKRHSMVSPRSTFSGTMPETIYHFQIMLEGIVAEDDLPSSFGSQANVRCVGAKGGVLGGSIVDKQNEIDEVNRMLWELDGGGKRDVVGLAVPGSDRRENLERIIDDLGTPLFDVNGNQMPKEFVVDRCLYNICSGKLSMEVAQKTIGAATAIEGTTGWLARRMEEFVGELADGVGTCEEKYIAPIECDKNLDEFDAAVLRLGIDGGKSHWI